MAPTGPSRPWRSRKRHRPLPSGDLSLHAGVVGAIALPVNTRLAPPEITQQLDDCRPTLLFHETELGETARRAALSHRQMGCT